MLVAEIRRKIADLDSLDEEGADLKAQLQDLLAVTKEDLLTADVFGTIKYLPRRPYLCWFFETVAARNPRASEFRTFLPQLIEQTHEFKFQFWPSYRTPAGLEGSATQPDLCFFTSTALFFVEAKLMSGFGERQVERELLAGLREAETEGREFFLLLVTPGVAPPKLSMNGAKLDIVQYLCAAADSGELNDEVSERLRKNATRVLWVNWQGIYQALAGAYQKAHSCLGEPSDAPRIGDMLADLGELLRMRGLHPFEGIGSRVPEISSSRPVFLEDHEKWSRGDWWAPSFTRMCASRRTQALPRRWSLGGGGFGHRRIAMRLKKIVAGRHLSGEGQCWRVHNG